MKKEKICPKCGLKFEIEKFDRKFCSRKCANSRSFSDITKQKISEKLLGEKGSGYIDGRTLQHKFCKKCGVEISRGSSLGYCKLCFHSSEEYKKKISESVKGKTGGYREGSNKFKGGYYKEKHFDSKFEIEVAIFLDKNDIKWIRNTKRMYFDWEGRKTYYIPDFYLIEFDTYLESKGYYWNRRERTLEAVRVNRLKWIELMQSEWILDNNILLEKISRTCKDAI